MRSVPGESISGVGCLLRLQSSDRFGYSIARTTRPQNSSSLISPLPPAWISKERRLFSTNIAQDEDDVIESNRAAFRAIPVLPSILSHIVKIGVGMRPKKSRQPRKSTSIKRKSNADTFDEVEEREFFSKSESQHRLQWQSSRDRNLGAKVVKGQQTMKSVTTDQNSDKQGAYWLPPPPSLLP